MNKPRPDSIGFTPGVGATAFPVSCPRIVRRGLESLVTLTRTYTWQGTDMYEKRAQVKGGVGGGRSWAHPLKPYERETSKVARQESRPLIGKHVSPQEGLKGELLAPSHQHNHGCCRGR